MIWVYQVYFNNDVSITMFDGPEEEVWMLADLFPNAIYFYAELTTD